MAGENTPTTLAAMFKVVYADKVAEMVPPWAILQNEIGFAAKAKLLGKYYSQPVALSHESGFTYNGTAGALATLNGPVQAAMEDAQVYGSELILQTRATYKALSQAASAGERAFKQTSSWLIKGMNDATRKRLEIAMLYGQSGLGTVSTVTDLGSSVAEIVITEATWAAGIWSGAEGSYIDSFTSTTKNNTGTLQITKVNCDSRKLTVSYSGTIANDCAAADVLFFKGSNAGSSSFNEMAGLQKQLTNTGSLFNINAGTYSLWAGNSVTVSGPLDFGVLQDATSKAVGKGLMSKVLCLVSPKAFARLATDQAAMRVFDGSYSSDKAKNGSKGITFFGANGEMEVKVHPMVKDGDAFVLPVSDIIRIGSVDLTFEVPSVEGEKFFTLVPNTNSVEFQCMADQAIFLEKPAHGVFLTGITYSQVVG